MGLWSLTNEANEGRALSLENRPEGSRVEGLGAFASRRVPPFRREEPGRQAVEALRVKGFGDKAWWSSLNRKVLEDP